MSVEKYTKLETFKGIKKKTNAIEQVFLDLKFNKKKPKYNYYSGLVAGMMVRDLTIMKPIIESKKSIDNHILQIMFEHLSQTAKGLVEDFNWNLFDLTQLAHQFFGEEE